MSSKIPSIASKVRMSFTCDLNHRLTCSGPPQLRLPVAAPSTLDTKGLLEEGEQRVLLKLISSASSLTACFLSGVLRPCPSVCCCPGLATARERDYPEPRPKMKGAISSNSSNPQGLGGNGSACSPPYSWLGFTSLPSARMLLSADPALE
eukprot:5068943-Amphidinium_carterae.1